MKNLASLLTDLPEKLPITADAPVLNAQVTSVTSDSREVIQGSVFVAITGETKDGNLFIDVAEKNGALIIIGEETPQHKLSVPFIKINNARQALAALASSFYGNPTKGLTTVGITGTSGKTTTSYLIESILTAAGYQVGVIGTINFRFGRKVLQSTHTTPGPVELQKLFSQMKNEGCDAIVMEVSSHALRHHRADFVNFDAVAFTNLSPEHMDFHQDMNDYFEAKWRLFKDCLEMSIRAGKRPFAAINGDDEYGRKILERLRANVAPEIWHASFGLANEMDINGTQLNIGVQGISGEAGGVKLKSPLSGKFNAMNILTAVAVAQGLGIDSGTISKGLSALKSVPGRLEKVPNTKGITILVDYAHKPDALEKVLKTLAEVKGNNRLITVFGCGGDRDRQKRPRMGKLAAEHSDRVFVTSDNPRTEDPNAIISEILEGMTGFSNYEAELDRKKAIYAAIKMAKAGDIVLIAGKGHEDYQIVADPSSPDRTQKIHFDDREVAAEALVAV